MRRITFLGVCFFLVLVEVIATEESRLQKRSLCASNCRNKCRDNNCNSNCDSMCSNPCNRKCRNSGDCEPDSGECEVEPQVKPTLTIVQPTAKQGESISKNVNQINNDYTVDINPNITMTNTISNLNNISVPINVTSVNVNNIRFTSTDTRRIDTNITSAPANCSVNRGQVTGCGDNKKTIVFIPFPFKRPQNQAIQEIIPPIQEQRVQTVVQQPIMTAPPVRPVILPYQVLPPVQRQEMVIPIQMAAPVQTPEYFQTILKPQIYNIPEPVPFNQQQVMWYPRQQIISQQEFIPQQQTLLPMQQTMLPISLPKPCSPSVPNSPCSAQSQIHYGAPCSTGDCLNRYPYVMTSPFSPTNGLLQFSSGNQYPLPSGTIDN